MTVKVAIDRRQFPLGASDVLPGLIGVSLGCVPPGAELVARVTSLGANLAAAGLSAAHVQIEEHGKEIALRSHAQHQGQRSYEGAGAKRTGLSVAPQSARMGHDSLRGAK